MENQISVDKQKQLQNKKNIQLAIFENLLVKLYPKCFFKERRSRRPIERNCFYRVRDDLTNKGFDQKYVMLWNKNGRGLLCWYTSDANYLVNVIRSKNRISINGEEVEEVITISQKEYSYNRLKELITQYKLQDNYQSNAKFQKFVSFLEKICRNFEKLKWKLEHKVKKNNTGKRKVKFKR